MRLLLPLLWLAACRPGTDTGTDDTATDPVDADLDGSFLPDDCDDGDADVFPGANELCDGKDDDCDGQPAFGEGDVDSDGNMDCTRCDAAGYWQATKGLDDPAALRAALDGVATATHCTYSVATSYMFLRLDEVDFEVECVYTGATSPVTNQRPDDMNTEHTWLQSEGADTEPAKCDLHNLYPTDITANTARANYPLDDVVSGVTWSVGGSQLGKNASGATVFEPRDVHKGNAARSMFYFAWRYHKTLTAAQITRFETWSDSDPVDQREWDRTTEIADQQGDENPFVACPDLVERAW